MVEALLVVITVLALVLLVICVLIWYRTSPDEALATAVRDVGAEVARVDRSTTEGLTAARKEAEESAHRQREELSKSMELFRSAISDTLSKLSDAQKERLEEFGKRLTENSEKGIRQLDEMRTSVDARLKSSQEETGKLLEKAREDATANTKAMREELTTTLKTVTDSLVKRIGDAFKVQDDRLDAFSRRLADLIEASDKRGETLKTTLEQRLDKLREENSQKLDEMRKVVDEKLQGTLERRLGESFKQVSDRLEQVHKGLGEMQTLASGVGDLKRVMTNVKTRGTWGEFQLAAILEAILSPTQFEANVATKAGSGERVEFAIRLPGRDGSDASVVYLPIDAKFPKEHYERLIEAQESADPDAVATASRQLEASVRACAKDICEKYINPPNTTDFAIMFLATEGLFAEVVRRVGVVEQCQRDWRVTISGPTTLAATLNSLQMGFRTLAIQHRSSEVWNVLGAVKTEFSKFGGVIQKVKKKLQEASNTVEAAESRTRVMNRKLRGVEELPAREAAGVLELSPEDGSIVVEVESVGGPEVPDESTGVEPDKSLGSQWPE
ncbi:MAG: DNA recombination protein RmuC [Phycisphaerales bacterium]|nr:DNA recombination protein RmuC [Phycisphaerales bacterium]